MIKVNTFFTKIEDGNLAFHVGDDEKDVMRNHKNLSIKYNYNIKNLRHMNQIHSNNIEIITKKSDTLISSCDALITKEVNIALMVMVADCIPILMYDEKKGVIAAIHAGRNSTFLKITQLSALKMINEFSCNKNDIKVILGPSIQKCCYEVDSVLRDIVKNSFGEEFIYKKNIDLQAINIKVLKNIGINNIEVSKICTKCNSEEYFSYRSNNNCGRFAGIIEIKAK